MTRATAALAAGVSLGASLMYFLDPERGSRRRTHARNQVIHASHRLQERARARVRSRQHASEQPSLEWPRPGRFAWLRGFGASRRRVAAAVAGATGVGLAARAAWQARNHQEIELRS